MLKESPLIDVFTLAALYSLRLFSGGLATGHLVSQWLLGFSGFLFLSLALLKRTEEIMMVRTTNSDHIARRGYRSGDAWMLQTLGCASAFASSVILVLFVGSTAASDEYQSPALLWPLVPLLLFWQSRLWLLTVRGEMHEDPIAFAARDWVSWNVLLCGIVSYTVASYGQ